MLEQLVWGWGWKVWGASGVFWGDDWWRDDVAGTSGRKNGYFPCQQWLWCLRLGFICCWIRFWVNHIGFADRLRWVWFILIWVSQQRREKNFGGCAGCGERGGDCSESDSQSETRHPRQMCWGFRVSESESDSSRFVQVIWASKIMLDTKNRGKMRHNLQGNLHRILKNGLRN